MLVDPLLILFQSVGSRYLFTFKIWFYLKLPTHVQSAHPYAHATLNTISLRLLALILCSNCSNTFNKVLTTTRCHTVKLLFETSSYHFSLLNIIHGWSKHFTSRYDPSTPTLTKPLNKFIINYPENDITLKYLYISS